MGSGQHRSRPIRGWTIDGLAAFPILSIRPAGTSFAPETISFSTGEVVAILLVLALMALIVVSILILGAVGFYRQGRGRRNSLIAKLAWPIGLIDLGMLLAGITQSPVVAVPIALHAIAFGIGRARSKDAAPPYEPPASPPSAPPPPPPTPPTAI